MKISVFGLGYVGSVLLGCLPEMGHEVTGVDIKSDKVEQINKGESPVYEPGLNERIKKYRDEGKIKAVIEADTALGDSEICLVCVGTPANLDGSINLNYIKSVTTAIGNALSNKSDYCVVGIRSTMLPGTTENIIIPILEKTSGRKLNEDFGTVMNPEFLREGHAVYDFFNPARTIIGESDSKAGEKFANVYSGIDAPVSHVPLKHAEMIKYIDNSYHGLKIAFANEIGAVCNRIGLDSRSVMELFYMDNKLNISTHYLKPGFAFGGMCIPKDLKALVHFSSEHEVEPPLLEAILTSNDSHIDRALSAIQKIGKTKIGILGLSFKENTDDLRESPVIKLINKIFEKSYLRLFDKTLSVSLYDPNVKEEQLNEVLPHFIQMLSNTVEDVVRTSELIVIGNANSELKGIKDHLTEDHVVLDLVKLFDRDKITNCKYITIS
jgi:GDP-mannose 6-dehydrogenase